MPQAGNILTLRPVNPVLQEKRTVQVLQNILHKNDHQAAHLRDDFSATQTLAVNIMGSPGSGKTTVIEKTGRALADKGLAMQVIEGDLETDTDTQRLTQAKIQAIQINTGQGCHLDAWMIKEHLPRLGQTGPFLFIENVGNLVCPAAYDIGAHLQVTLLSVPEGDDKVAKYPVIFQASHVLLLTKLDAAGFFSFNTQRVVDDYLKLNPAGKVFELQQGTGAGFQDWLSYLIQFRQESL